MLSKAWDYIKVNKMIEKGDRIVVGVSGGADSVCLLYVLDQDCKELGASLTVVHINHGIRGEEAAHDQQFVQKICYELDIDYCDFAYDVKRIAKEQGLSEEEAGRNVRYEAFLEICKTKQCNKIAIAHNKNDNAETVLFHLFRGTGIKGLSGIEPKRMIHTDFGNITVIRPLLCIDRKEIEEFLRNRGILYRTDSTNLTECYSRNKIRNRILNYAVTEINTGAIGNIAETSLQLREAQDYIYTNVIKRYQQLVTQEGSYYRISVEEMRLEHPVLQKGIIFQMMENLAGKRKDLEAKHVEAVQSLFDKQVGRSVHLPYGMIAEREYSQLRLFTVSESTSETSAPAAINSVKLTIPGKTGIREYHKIFETELINYKNNVTIPKSSCVKWFDYDKIENAVDIRARKAGDYIQINDSGGKKKLKDYFIDRKIPKMLRDSQLLLADGSHIMWVIGEGERMSEKYKVDNNTKRVLSIKMFDLEENVDDR